MQEKLESSEHRDEAPPLLLHVFPSFGYGGVPIRIAGIINALGPRFRHHIIALDGNDQAKSRINTALDVIVTGSPAAGRAGPVVRFRAIRSLLRETGPDLLLTYNWGAIEWALAVRTGGGPVHLHFESGFGPEEADRQFRRRVLTRRFALKNTFRVVVPSKYLAAIARDVWRISEDRLLRIPNGVDIGGFSVPARPPRSPDERGGTGITTIGTVAPLRTEKNLGLLLRAFAQLPARDVRLIIAGDGPERHDLENLAGELGIAQNVSFPGHVDNVAEIFAALDVFCMTSDTEQMPNSLLQAMASGRAVAATDAGDVKFMLSPENRDYVTARGDAAGFAGALKALCGDPGLRERLGRENKARTAAEFSLDEMVGAYGRLFDAALSVRQSAKSG